MISLLEKVEIQMLKGLTTAEHFNATAVYGHYMYRRTINLHMMMMMMMMMIIKITYPHFSITVLLLLLLLLLLLFIFVLLLLLDKTGLGDVMSKDCKDT